MKLGYILLVHEPFEQLRPLLDTLTKFDDVIALHYDKAVPHADDIELIHKHYPSVLFTKREKVEWGEASIVQATLNGMQAIVDSEHNPDYVTLLSGSCFPIASRDQLLKELSTRAGSEFIECHDISESKWVKGGLEKSRWELFHYINWRKSPRLFSLSEKIQKKLKIKRQFPFGEKMYMGSQWWTLSYSMIENILSVTKKYKLMPFVNNTWIPDEFYFQTLVANLVTDSSFIKKPLMHYRFNEKGIPKIFTHLNTNELVNASASKKYFTRKIKQSDNTLLSQLSDAYISTQPLQKNKELTIKETFEMHWYKQHGFRNWLSDYPLPIVIIIEPDPKHSIMPTLTEGLKNALPFLNIYGDLFNKEKIDFNKEPSLGLYQESDIKLRDYDWQEFMSHISFSSPSGFVFKSTSRHLNGLIDSLKNTSNVLFIDICTNLRSLSEIEKTQTLSRYLSGYACKYMRFTSGNLDEIHTIVESHMKNNLYMHALQTSSSKATL